LPASVQDLSRSPKGTASRHRPGLLTMIEVNGSPPVILYGNPMNSRIKWAAVLGAMLVVIFGYAFYINLV
jgi:hypothetical protein